MKKTLLISIFFSHLICFLPSQNQTEISNTLLESLVSDEHVIGAAGSYSVDGKILWERAVGFDNEDKKSPFKLDTEIRTASIAKSMTAVAVMQLVEKGQIDINLPIDHYIPEFVQKSDTKITTKHLLSHTSGIDGYKNNREAENKTNYVSLVEAYNVFKDRKLRFEPGTEFHYTSYGYVVLGLLIEKVSGLSFEEYMQKNVWEKADMQHTGIEKDISNNEKASNLYHKYKKGKIKEADVNNLSNRVPAGGFYSTVSDLIKFGNALLQNTLVSEDTFNLMREHHSLEKVNNGYGFGFYLYGQQPNEGVIIGHNGAQTGASSQLFIIPSLKTVIAVVSNTSGSGKEVSTVAGRLIDISQKEN
ncbi:MAG: serine hydrolase domain-containing protein [Winogradskyella sp.]|jgi:CubicO group peptidase (beta-lactamase class C family)